MAKLVRKVITLQPERIKEIQEIEPNVSAFVRMAVVEKLTRHYDDKQEQIVDAGLQVSLIGLAACFDELERRKRTAKDPKERQAAAAALKAARKRCSLRKDQLRQVDEYRRMFGSNPKGGKRMRKTEPLSLKGGK